MATATPLKPETLRTLPSDAVRQIQWRFADRYDLQMLVQSVRSVARGPVARLVAVESRQNVRPLGFARDEIWIADDFDAPLPDEILAAFNGNVPTKTSKRKRKRK